MAYVGSFNQVGDYYKPAFCFTVGKYFTEKNIGEVVSHEVGHTLGLSHDGTTIVTAYGTEYYNGHANWGPIMGGNGNAVTQWSKGEYTYANNKEDDLAIIQAHGGVYFPDDYGNSMITAYPLAGQNINISGMIERNTDVDYFAITTGAGTISLDIKAAVRGPNLDIKATLFDSGGSVLVMSDLIRTVTTAQYVGQDLTGMPAIINTTVPAGTYYLAIDGVGTGDPTTGYSDYASLGQYTITGTVSSSVSSQPPVAKATATPTATTTGNSIQFSSAGSTDPDGTISSYLWNFGDNQTSTEANPVHSYSTAGTFIVNLTVTDNVGLSNTKSITITISNPPPVAQIIHVDQINLALYTSRKTYGAKATVIIKDANNNLVSGAVVSGTWSGLVTGTGSAVTNTAGIAVISSPTTAAAGTFTFTVNNITGTNLTYNATANLETTDSIIRTATTRK